MKVKRSMKKNPRKRAKSYQSREDLRPTVFIRKHNNRWRVIRDGKLAGEYATKTAAEKAALSVYRNPKRRKKAPARKRRKAPVRARANPFAGTRRRFIDARRKNPIARVSKKKLRNGGGVKKAHPWIIFVLHGGKRYFYTGSNLNTAVSEAFPYKSKEQARVHGGRLSRKYRKFNWGITDNLGRANA